MKWSIWELQYTKTCNFIDRHMTHTYNCMLTDSLLRMCQLTLQTANRSENTRLKDTVATDFWSNNRQRAFFDIHVFNPLLTLAIPSQSDPPIRDMHEQEKRHEYDQCVREVEHGRFSPLVFNTLGGMGPTACVVYKRNWPH